MVKARKNRTASMVNLDEIHEDPANANERDDVEDIKDSFRDFGQDQDIVVQMETGRIIKGNHRFRAAKELGWSQIHVYWVDDDDLKATRRALADNRIGEQRHWKDDVLSRLLGEVGADDTPGFNDEYYQDLLEKMKGMDSEGEDNGDPSLSDFWPFIRVKVTPDEFALWEALVETHDGEREAMGYLLSNA